MTAIASNNGDKIRTKLAAPVKSKKIFEWRKYGLVATT